MLCTLFPVYQELETFASNCILVNPSITKVSYLYHGYFLIDGLLKAYRLK